FPKQEKKRRGSPKNSSKNDGKEIGEAAAIPLRRKCECRDGREVYYTSLFFRICVRMIGKIGAVFRSTLG
ncbi:hypothetical protein, partial [Bacillus cytotoxicus]|uniref:hypothetical protein n=1 Tax=Bacillus cytotoxicus TaxID=580165 RepID=UPI003B79E69F